MRNSDPHYHGYMYDKMYSLAFKLNEHPSPNYIKQYINNRLSSWVTDLNFMCRVCLDVTVPVGFYTLFYPSFEPSTGEHRFFIEEFHSDDVRASWHMWNDLQKIVKHHESLNKKIYGFIQSNNKAMIELYESLGFTQEKIQIVKEIN